MKNISIWKDTIKMKQYKELDEDKEVDVLIVGGGITGVSTLYQLRESDLNVMLVEQNKIGQSVTGNSTGKLNYLQNDLIDKIRNNFNDDVARYYIKSQKYSIQSIINIIKKEKIVCDLEQVEAYLYTNKDNEIEKLKNLEQFLLSSSIPVKKNSIDVVKSKYMISVDDTYIFHPIKYIKGLLKNNIYPIYENTSIKKIEKDNDKYICHTDKYKIKTKWVVIASHYPYFNLPYLFPIKGSLEKSYLSASKYQGKSLSLISYSYPFISIRNYKDYLIYLSNSHSLNSDVEFNKNFKELKKKINDLNLEPEYLWSNIDIMTNDGLPYIGIIDDKLLIGTGYNTWGLTNGPLAGIILSDIILGKSNEYIELFNPKRSNLSQLLGGISDAFQSMEGYIKGYLDKSDVEYSKYNGVKTMTYNDENGSHKVCRKCPHLGCSLVLNKVEKTWDCPCHGSRFDIDGKCISGPSNHDINV